uniref:Uncharacterized protein n=1 Tax=Anguilla anguilla TaxID=7936 RepID=A0A0E9PAD1_ANGAN
MGMYPLHTHQKPIQNNVNDYNNARIRPTIRIEKTSGEWSRCLATPPPH